jgi:hypothetical protein
MARKTIGKEHSLCAGNSNLCESANTIIICCSLSCTNYMCGVVDEDRAECDDYNHIKSSKHTHTHTDRFTRVRTHARTHTQHTHTITRTHTHTITRTQLLTHTHTRTHARTHARARARARACGI